MDTNLQHQLFRHLKESLPQHLSLTDELCDLLDLSADSVYRRIRGEKPITLLELKRICEHYQLSVDRLLQLQNESVIFQAPGLNGAAGGLADYLKGMLGQFQYFNSFKVRELQYLCKDIPFWYFYLFPEMGAFKTFFWTRNIHNDPELSHQQFSMKEYSYTDCFTLGQKILLAYNEIPSVEIWNLESIHSTINQIAYYRDAGIFKSVEDLDAVINSFYRMIDHLELQAEKGQKFVPGASDISYRSNVQFYINELILGNNTILLHLDNKRLSIITHSVLNYLMTNDDRFAEKSFSTLNSLVTRSTLVSRTGEKDRNKFFNILREKVNTLKN